MKKVLRFFLELLQAITIILIPAIYILQKRSMTVARTLAHYNFQFTRTISDATWTYGAVVLFLILILWSILKIVKKRHVTMNVVSLVIAVCALLFSMLATEYRGYFLTIVLFVFIFILHFTKEYFFNPDKHPY